jgi:uncharacterized protein
MSDLLESRQFRIESQAGDGNLGDLKVLFRSGYTQLELDTALGNAIAYSQIDTAEYLLSLGADFSNYDYQGVYYSVHNSELKGLKFAISKGVDININNGILLNTSIMTSIYSQEIEIVKWLIENGANPKYLTKESIKVAYEFGTDELKSLIKNVT